MKRRIPSPSPAMTVAVIALFVALGGTAVAFSLGRNSVHSRNIAPGAVRSKDLGKTTLRFGKVVDTDPRAYDGSFNYATGHGVCEKGDRVIGGGERQIAGGAGATGQHLWLVESGELPGKREFYAIWNSDLGGAARADYLVYAKCLAK